MLDIISKAIDAFERTFKRFGSTRLLALLMVTLLNGVVAYIIFKLSILKDVDLVLYVAGVEYIAALASLHLRPHGNGNSE